ncbi:MAG UNVERIFIED_CONTAM: hypothetical protein LVR29_13540 [Microcystis novacekii LVE1205-3]
MRERKTKVSTAIGATCTSLGLTIALFIILVTSYQLSSQLVKRQLEAVDHFLLGKFGIKVNT